MKKSAPTPAAQASGLFHRMFGVGVGAGHSLPVRKLMLAVLLPVVATTNIWAAGSASEVRGGLWAKENWCGHCVDTRLLPQRTG